MTDWKLSRWTGLHANMIRRKTPGDGSCLIHSVLYSVSDAYREMELSNREKLTRKIRDEMANNIRLYWDNIIVNKDLAKIVEDAIEKGTENELDDDIIAQYSLENVVEDLKCDSFLNETLVRYLSLLFNINIIIYSVQNKNQYHLGVEQIIDYDKQSTIIVAHSGNHFETMGQKLGEDHVLLIFSNTHPTIEQILYLSPV